MSINRTYFKEPSGGREGGEHKQGWWSRVSQLSQHQREGGWMDGGIVDRPVSVIIMCLSPSRVLKPEECPWQAKYDYITVNKEEQPRAVGMVVGVVFSF